MVDRMETEIFILRPQDCGDIISPPESVPITPDIQTKINIMNNKANSEDGRYQSQITVENYLASIGTCAVLNPDLIQKYKEMLFAIDYTELDRVLSTGETLNSSIHMNVSCIVEAIIGENKYSNTLEPTHIERIHNWFRNPRMIGEPSAEGYVMKTSRTMDTNLFVVKTPLPGVEDNLIHETVVGLYALNKLRKFLPNYMYIYGITKCTPTIFDKKEPIIWCDTGGASVSYMYTENIRDAVSLGDYIKSVDSKPEDLLLILYQVFNALNLAYVKYQFTHYDLHHGNVMVRKFNSPVGVPNLDPNTGNINGHFITRYVPYIIDYGYAHVEVSGINLGKLGLEHGAVFSSKAFPMHDIYKLLCFCGSAVYENKPRNSNEVFRMLDKLFSFFDEGSLLDRLEHRIKPMDYYFIADKRYIGIKYQEYINWMHTKFAPHVSYKSISCIKSKGFEVFEPEKMDICNFFDKFAYIEQPSNSLEFCELVTSLNDDKNLTPEKKVEIINVVIKNFNIEDQFVKEIDQIYKAFDEINTIAYKWIPVINVENNIIKKMASFSRRMIYPAFIDSYRKSILALLSIRTLHSEMDSKMHNNYCMVKTTKLYNEKIKDIFIDIKRATEKIVKYLKSQYDILSANEKVIKSYKYWRELTNDPRILYFWLYDHLDLINA